MLTQSLQRIAKACRDLAKTNPLLECCEGRDTVSVCCPRDRLWVEIKQAPNAGFDERISLTEYRVHAYQTAYAASAWEAITTMTQKLNGGNS